MTFLLTSRQMVFPASSLLIDLITYATRNLPDEVGSNTSNIAHVVCPDNNGHWDGSVHSYRQYSCPHHAPRFASGRRDRFISPIVRFRPQPFYPLRRKERRPRNKIKPDSSTIRRRAFNVGLVVSVCVPRTTSFVPPPSGCAFRICILFKHAMNATFLALHVHSFASSYIRCSELGVSY